MRIDENGMALLYQYAEGFVKCRSEAINERRTFDQAIHDSQIHLLLHLIAVLGADADAFEPNGVTNGQYKHALLMFSTWLERKSIPRDEMTHRLTHLFGGKSPSTQEFRKGSVISFAERRGYA